MRIKAMAVAAAFLMAGLTATPAGAEESPTKHCVERSTENIAEFQAVARELIAAGELTQAEADAAFCDPLAGINPADLTESPDPVETIDASPAPSPSATKKNKTKKNKKTTPPIGELVTPLATRCEPATYYLRTSARQTQTKTSFGKDIYSGNITLGWCYSKSAKRVREWFGTCDGNVTRWGQVNGWHFDGCSSDQYIPYKLGPNFPGGVHHYSKMLFINVFSPLLVSNTIRISIWGHYDGTCDTQHGTQLFKNRC